MEPPPSPSLRRSPGWVEVSVALAALVVSAVSLYIAQRQTSVMDRQLAASVWPAMEYATSNIRDGESVITLSLDNVGVGPARLYAFRVSHGGQEVTDPTEFVRQCCAPEGTPFHTITSFIDGRILPAGHRIDFLTLRPEGQTEVFKRFDRVRGELEVELCYCSVLEECWFRSTTDVEPRAVRSCGER